MFHGAHAAFAGAAAPSAGRDAPGCPQLRESEPCARAAPSLQLLLLLTSISLPKHKSPFPIPPSSRPDQGGREMGCALPFLTEETPRKCETGPRIKSSDPKADPEEEQPRSHC